MSTEKKDEAPLIGGFLNGIFMGCFLGTEFQSQWAQWMVSPVIGEPYDPETAASD